MAYQHITVPADGQKIRINADFSLTVPTAPIIPFIEGDVIDSRRHPHDLLGICDRGHPPHG